MTSILFVDDEPNVLAGLQRMLRTMRHEWDMSFAESGKGALAILAEKHVDVLVSDMKMPGMDGAQLIQTVMEQYPQVIRIILSGYSEKDLTMRSVGTAHQYLSKPCDAESLKAAVQHVSELRNVLTDSKLRRLVSQLPTIPSLPLYYTELIEELGKPEPSSRKVGEIVRSDIGMTVKLLQLVNSAFFGLRRHVSNSAEAVQILGLDTIGSLTLGLGVISQFEDFVPKQFYSEIWAHSLAVGVMSHTIAVCENQEIASDAFTAGLLHDIGKIVLALNLPDKVMLVNEIAEHEGLSDCEAEQRVFEATHADVGAYLLGLWGLPSRVVQAVAFHHRPSETSTDSFTALTAVHAASAIQNSTAGKDDEPNEPRLDRNYLSNIGLLDRIPVWQERCALVEGEPNS